MRYYLKIPTGRAVSFRIVCRTDTDSPVANTTLDSVNASIKEGTLSRSEARKSLKEVVRQLNRDAGLLDKAVFNNDNEKVLKKYWEKYYIRKKIVDKQSSWTALLRSVRHIQELSLATASYDELQNSVDTLPSNKQRKVVQSLNQLLQFMNRDFELNKAREERTIVKFLTEKELKLLLPHLPTYPIQLLHQVCFYTGCRIGEAFAIEVNCINAKEGTLKVFEQIDKKGKTRDPKNGKHRFAYISAKSIPIIKKWLLVKADIDMKTRIKMAKITRNACSLAFPGNKTKNLKFHDMRHSYAIGLVSKGVSITAVAQCLGNGVGVCEKYYVGHQLTSETVQMIKALVEG